MSETTESRATLHTVSGKFIQIRTKDSKPYTPIYSNVYGREISDKNRILREASKYYAELEKRKEIEASDESHTTEVIQALLTESMRQAMDDEIRKKWNGSNTYRPPENTNYEILAIDPNADK